MVPVCHNTFMGALNIKKDRIQGVLKRHFESGGKMATENRGGDKRSHSHNQERIAVHAFIEKLQGKEPHYCR